MELPQQKELNAQIEQGRLHRAGLRYVDEVCEWMRTGVNPRNPQKPQKKPLGLKGLREFCLNGVSKHALVVADLNNRVTLGG